MRHALLFSFLLLLVPACDSEEDPIIDPIVDAAQPITGVDGVCEALSEEICAGLEDCDCRFDVRAYDAAGCVAARKASCLTNLAAVSADIDAGHARVEPSIADACVTALRVMTDACTLGGGIAGPLPTECDTIVLAAAAIGEECTLGSGGLAFCGATGDGVCLSNESNTETCTALPGDGAECLQGLCKRGFVCAGTTCAVPGADGDACLQSQTCAAGLICAPDMKCRAPLAASVACTSPEQCAPGLVCQGEVCTELLALGDGCSSSFACGSQRSCGRAPETRTCTDADGQGDDCMEDTCGDGLACDGTDLQCVLLPGDGAMCLDGSKCAAGFTCLDGVGTCAALPGTGEACAMGQRFCADGLGCRVSDQTCQPGPGVGEECFLNPPDYVCGEGLGCDFGTNGSVCQTITGAGEPCSTDRTCAPPTYCELSTMECTTRLAAGAACEDGNECQAGHECALLPGGPVCAPLPVRDAACLFDCADDLACKGPGGACVVAFCTIPG